MSGDLVRLGIVRSAAFLFELIVVLGLARRAAKVQAMCTPIYSGIIVAFYNIGWTSFDSVSAACLIMLKQDVHEGFDTHHVDVLLLSGCCGGKDFEKLMNDICHERDFVVCCQSSFVCIARKSTIKIIKAPKLRKASRQSPCQQLQVTFKSSRQYQSLNIFNVQLSDSEARQTMLKWFGARAPSNSLIGGATHSNLFGMSGYFDFQWHWYFQTTYKHGDVICGRDLTADSLECGVSSAARDKHRMCVVHVQMKLRKEEKSSLDVALINEFRKRRQEVEDEGPENHGKKPKRMPRSNSVKKPSSIETPPVCSEPQDEKSPSCSVDFERSESEESSVSPERKATPHADEMLKVAGALENSSQLIDTLLTRLGTELWDRTPRNEPPTSFNDPRRPQQIKERLNDLIEKSMFALQKYGPSQAHAQTGDRSLIEDEMNRLTNAWRNDVENWMNPECLQKYRQLQQEQEKLHWKKNKKGKGKGKNRRDHAGPAQRAHQLKRSRFQVFMNRVAINKEFFMEFIRDPSLRKPCGMLRLLDVLKETRTTRSQRDQDQC